MERAEGQPVAAAEALQVEAMETDGMSAAEGATGGAAEAAGLNGSQDSSYVLVSNPQDDAIMTRGELGDTDATLGEGESSLAEGQQQPHTELTDAAGAGPASPSASSAPYKVVQLDVEGRRCLRCPAARHCTGCPLPVDDEALELPQSDASPYRSSSSYADREPKLTLACEWSEQSMKRYRAERETVAVSGSGEGADADGSSSGIGSGSAGQHRVHLSDCLMAFCKEEVLSEQDPVSQRFPSPHTACIARVTAC